MPPFFSFLVSSNSDFDKPDTFLGTNPSDLSRHTYTGKNNITGTDAGFPIPTKECKLFPPMRPNNTSEDSSLITWLNQSEDTQERCGYRDMSPLSNQCRNFQGAIKSNMCFRTACDVVCALSELSIAKTQDSAFRPDPLDGRFTEQIVWMIMVASIIGGTQWGIYIFPPASYASFERKGDWGN